MDLSFEQGQLSKAVMIRLKPGCDLIEGIENVCQKLDIESGVITCCIGSLQNHA